MKIPLTRKKTIFRVGLLLLILFAAVIAYLFMSGILWFNNPSHKKYPVRGVDVSHYQGDIDWQRLSEQGICFAFIKATEGSTHVDKKFELNWKDSRQTDLFVGAYHFFSFESSGIKQAENFIKNVPTEQDSLPPVIDIEFYGDFSKSPQNADEVRKELEDMVSALEQHYKKPVIIYTTQSAYSKYIEGYFLSNPIWIRNVYTRPTLRDDRIWTFWQYSDHGRLDGYKGVEGFIDLNAFNGSFEDLLEFCQTTTD